MSVVQFLTCGLMSNLQWSDTKHYAQHNLYSSYNYYYMATNQRPYAEAMNIVGGVAINSPTSYSAYLIIKRENIHKGRFPDTLFSTLEEARAWVEKNYQLYVLLNL